MGNVVGRETETDSAETQMETTCVEKVFFFSLSLPSPIL